MQTNKDYSRDDGCACVGRTVKEITSYFENISKLRTLPKRIDPVKLITQSAKSTLIATFPNPYIPCITKQTGLESRSYPRRPKKQYSVLKDTLFHGNAPQKIDTPLGNHGNIMDMFKDTLKSSMMTCVLMIQNILWWKPSRHM